MTLFGSDITHWHHIIHGMILNPVESFLDVTHFGLLFLFGLVTSWHCVGMCCPLYGAVLGRTKGMASSLYHLGRWISYMSVASVLQQMLAAADTVQSDLGSIIATAMGLLLIFFGLAKCFSLPVAKWFSPVAHIWPQSLWLRLTKVPPQWRAFPLGLLTGLLPCMTLTPVYVAAAGSHSLAFAWLTMSGFLLGTLPAFIFARSIPERFGWLKKWSQTSSFIGLFWILAGAITIARQWH